LKEDDHVRNCIAPANFNQIRNYDERKINISNISSKLKINALNGEKKTYSQNKMYPNFKQLSS
jgi:hypothetical protein